MAPPMAASAASIYKGPKGPLRHRCPLCPATGPQLLRCSGCRAIRYCSREHQVAHRLQHKSACNKIKNARNKLAREDNSVRNATEDFMMPANAFETHVGRFWGILGTRDYMRARTMLVRKLEDQGTLDGIHEGLEHLQDMLRLCRSDNMGLRDITPYYMLRLDLDQECYDFIKWWATCDPDGTYDWGDMTLPHLNIHGADVLEPPLEGLALNHGVVLLLLKLKLLVDIRNLKVARKVLSRTRLPLELRDLIEREVIRSPLSTKFQKGSYESLVKTENEPLSDESTGYSPGSWEEMAITMRYSYAAWWESEGVLDLLNDARACAERDSESEIEDRMQDEKSRKGQTEAELISDLGVNRIWGYLDYAIENASYLGPYSERPSERYTRDNREAFDQAMAEDDKFGSLPDDEKLLELMKKLYPGDVCPPPMPRN